MVKIRILSDLHLEGFQNYSKLDFVEYKDEDVLVLAGDIDVGPNKIVRALKFFKNLGYKKVIFTPGNHEFYRHTFSEVWDALADLNEKDIHVLNAREIIAYDDVYFYGGPLFTDFNNADPRVIRSSTYAITDFRLIKGITATDYINEFKRQSSFILETNEHLRGKKQVIVTHFLPTLECISERFRENDDFNINRYFANDLDVYGLENTTWIYGHTHDAGDFQWGGCRLVCNPRGYPREDRPTDKNYDPFKTIEV